MAEAALGPQFFVQDFRAVPTAAHSGRSRSAQGGQLVACVRELELRMIPVRAGWTQPSRATASCGRGVPQIRGMDADQALQHCVDTPDAGGAANGPGPTR